MALLHRRLNWIKCQPVLGKVLIQALLQRRYDFVDGDAIAEDCDGHGTHVAATAIGRSVGAAKSARVVAVRILDCAGR